MTSKLERGYSMTGMKYEPYLIANNPRVIHTFPLINAVQREGDFNRDIGRGNSVNAILSSCQPRFLKLCKARTGLLNKLHLVGKLLY